MCYNTLSTARPEQALRRMNARLADRRSQLSGCAGQLMRAGHDLARRKAADPNHSLARGVLTGHQAGGASAPYKRFCRRQKPWRRDGFAIPSIQIPKGEGRLRRPKPKTKGNCFRSCLLFWCARRESNKPSYFLLPFSRETWRQNLGFPYRFATFTSVLSHQFLPIKGKPKGKTARPNRTAEITSRRALSFLPRPPDW